VVISPRVGVGDTSRGGSSGFLNSFCGLHVDPFLGSGHLIVSAVPVALGDSVGSVVGDTSVSQAVRRRLGSDGRQNGITGLDLGSSGMRDSGVRSNVLGRLGVVFSGLSIIVRGLVFLGKGLNLGNCVLLA
jgi:hypothetical protein